MEYYHKGYNPHYISLETVCKEVEREKPGFYLCQVLPSTPYETIAIFACNNLVWIGKDKDGNTTFKNLEKENS